MKNILKLIEQLCGRETKDEIEKSKWIKSCIRAEGKSSTYTQAALGLMYDEIIRLREENSILESEIKRIEAAYNYGALQFQFTHRMREIEKQIQEMKIKYGISE